ncbi:hypothetical protein IQ266_21280 [filamentous cyanobacterium LEGE 11480]|uniref:Uncharacterized protein n=1 Tax=Romeriopsis navalis LEGE 11480 TaxID=2777977 RepID=A0A928VTG9_9CYAN|nr:hypothetical protein [Romeriopsis navalis]MBE9032275.1 hypothetical protein [Romeriopsis navalis LEGE 11480]
MTTSSQRWILGGTAIGLLSSLYIFVVKDIFQPLSGGGDSDYWEYTGYYLAHHLQLFPKPHLILISNEAFYPYGVSQVFQPWGLERDLFYASLSSLFGPGGWLQIYYLLSVLLTFIGVFYLLRRDYGFWRSLGAGLLMSGGAFYAVLKYPHHHCYAAVHWTILSFVVDFLLLKRCLLKQPIVLRLWLIRGLLVILSLGQELAYVASYGLMSFSLTQIWLWGTIGVRSWGQSVKQLRQRIQQQIQQWRSEWKRHKTSILALGLSLIVTSYFYIPLVLQIAQTAKSFDFQNVDVGNWWTHPLRFLLPIFVDTIPTPFWIDEWLGDNHEANIGGTPGWFLLSLAIMGLWALRRQRRLLIALIPMMTILVLAVLYHPKTFPTINAFPWLTFHRVGSRLTLMYPVILGLFAVHANLPQPLTNSLKRFKRPLAIGILTILAVAEIGTAYGWKNQSYQPYHFQPEFQRYIETVKAQPGEAVLDFPFCVAGGNGLTNGMCPFYKWTVANFAFRRFHGKKVVGQYFGRLHPDQAAEITAAGWPQMFSSDQKNNIHQAQKQTVCFNDQQWKFFESFYYLNDFAGINLYTNLLLPDCIQQFYTRFGQPISRTKIPAVGNAEGTVEFIPKPPAMRERVDLYQGRRLRLDSFQ